MTTANMTTATDGVKTKLSTLWVVVMVCLLGADVLSSYIPGAAEELTRFAGGTPIPVLMLFGSIMMAIPIGMIFLSRVLTYGVNRWVNIIAVVFTIAYVIGGGSAYPHYILLAAIEIIAMLLIIWYVWRWPGKES